MQTRAPNWPTAAVLCTALIAIAATVLAGPSLGLDGETLRYILSAEAGLGLIVTAIMRGLFQGGGAAVLALALLSAVAVSSSGCSSGTAAVPAMITVRDATCTGGRVVCRALDRVCRASGGPAVLDEPPGPTSGGDAPTEE